MNMQFLRGTRRVLTVIPMVVVLLTGTSSAMAQVTSTAPVVAPAPPARSVTTIVITGTVPGPPEDVSFSKAAVEIGSTLTRASDPALPPVLIIDITFLKAAGVGATTKTKFTAQAEVIKTRTFATTQVLAITFPFNEDKGVVAVTPDVNSAVLSAARSGLATFTITVDAKGTITGAFGSIGANTFAL